MEILWKLLRNFWFCLSMAVINLLFIMQSLTDGSSPWLSAIGVVCWAFLAHRSTKTQHKEVPLTDEQTAKIRVATQRFSREMSEILKEATNDESNNGEDKEKDKGESSDE